MQNWAFLTYLHGKPRNTYIYPMQECENVSNTSRHQEVVASLLNLPCYCHLLCFENFKGSFWKIMIYAAVTLFFWRSEVFCLNAESNIIKLSEMGHLGTQLRYSFPEIPPPFPITTPTQLKFGQRISKFWNVSWQETDLKCSLTVTICSGIHCAEKFDKTGMNFWENTL